MERSTVWLCGACGRTGKTRVSVGDESCYLHSVEVYEDSIERDANGRIVKATAALPPTASTEIGLGIDI